MVDHATRMQVIERVDRGLGLHMFVTVAEDAVLGDADETPVGPVPTQ